MQASWTWGPWPLGCVQKWQGLILGGWLGEHCSIPCASLYDLLVLVSQSYPTLCDPMDHSLPGSSVPGILQARTLEWVAIPFSRESSWPRGQTWVSCIEGRFSTVWAVGEALGMTCLSLCFKPPQQCDPCRLTPQRTPHSAGQHLLRACPGPAAIRCDKMIRAPAPLPSSPPPFQACQLPAPFYCCPNK